MNRRTLIHNSLIYYWRTNLAVMLGVAVAVAVLSGALLVGDSVRGSLRDLVLQRLGKTDHAVISTTFFREALSADIEGDPDFSSSFSGIAPLILTRGSVSVQGAGGRTGNVAVYGVDERFWRFQGLGPEIQSEGALISPALAEELGQTQDATLLIRVQRPSDLPLESLHSRKDEASKTIRVTAGAILPLASLGEFTLQAQQGEVRAVFLPLERVQAELDVRDRVNTLLISGGTDTKGLEPIIQRHATLDDLGLQLRVLPNNTVTLESRSGILDDAIASAAQETGRENGLPEQPVLTYLANSMTIGNRGIPYSLVTATTDAPFGSLPDTANPPILLNDWAARDIGARVGDALTMEYFVWQEPGQLVTQSTEFRVAGIVPLSTGDKDFAPNYPGITDAVGIADWNPPFPIDLRRVRPVDEDYWHKYSTTPKAFIPLEAGQRLWRTRYGGLTSIRFTSSPADPETVRRSVEERLRAKLDPLASGLNVIGVRAQSLDASRGATDFGEYFVYFSFFLVVSALMLAALFFKLSVEQRVRELGLLRAVGIPFAESMRLFLSEGLVLSVIGALLGIVGAAFYAGAILWALGNWWVGAVGTRDLTLHLSAPALIGGGAGGVLAAVACIALTLRGLRRVSERTLLAGELGDPKQGASPSRRRPLFAIVLAVLALALLFLGSSGTLPSDGAFFGTGFLLLAAGLSYQLWRLRRPSHGTIAGSGWRPVSAIAFRNAAYRPARSVAVMTAIASAAFILISVDAFRKDAPTGTPGGYALIVETLAPIVNDPNSNAGKQALNLQDLTNIRFEPFRLRPGDDASCLNLYEPRNPQILAPRDSFLQAGRFTFQGSLATTDAERQNPWILLNRTEDDGSVPVIADANSLTYVLHKSVGDEFIIPNGSEPVKLRFVGALSDSIFQGSLLMSEANFLKLFPGQEGYSMLLGETSEENLDAMSDEIETALTDYGADVTPTASRLAEFHRVENTYLSTFQMLGALGLLLGTLGLAAVLLRSVLERRRELALFCALGYEQRHLFLMTVVENASLLVKGLAIGTISAAIAIAPAALERGSRLPVVGLAPLFTGILLLGLIIAILATRVALRGSLLASLRSE